MMFFDSILEDPDQKRIMFRVFQIFFRDPDFFADPDPGSGKKSYPDPDKRTRIQNTGFDGSKAFRL